MCLEHNSKRLFAATYGQGRCCISQLQHGLAAQFSHGAFVDMSAPGIAQSVFPTAMATEQTYHNLQSPSVGGPCNFLYLSMSSIITCTDAGDKSASTVNRGEDNIAAANVQLTPQHEMILLGSQQLWKVMDKDEVALRGHFHIRACHWL